MIDEHSKDNTCVVASVRSNHHSKKDDVKNQSCNFSDNSCFNLVKEDKANFRLQDISCI